jgi:hypothetical protein
MKPIRQSVTVPGNLAAKIARGAKRKHLTFSKALIEYARLGVAEEARAKEKVRSAVEKMRAAKSLDETETLVTELAEAVLGPRTPPQSSSS